MRRWASRFRNSIENLSPEQIALVLSVGLLLGVFPIMGIPTVLCLLAALGLRLNVVALQLLNSASSPLQLALLVPLERVGARLCGGAISSEVTTAGKIWTAARHAVAGWTCICIPAAVLLYFILILVLRGGGQGWLKSFKARASFVRASVAVGSLPSGS